MEVDAIVEAEEGAAVFISVKKGGAPQRAAIVPRMKVECVEVAFSWLDSPPVAVKGS